MTTKPEAVKRTIHVCIHPTIYLLCICIYMLLLYTFLVPAFLIYIYVQQNLYIPHNISFPDNSILSSRVEGKPAPFYDYHFPPSHWSSLRTSALSKGQKKQKLAFTYSLPPNLPYVFFSHPPLLSHQPSTTLDWGEAASARCANESFFPSKSVPSPRNMLKRNAMPRNHHLTCCVGR